MLGTCCALSHWRCVQELRGRGLGWPGVLGDKSVLLTALIALTPVQEQLEGFWTGSKELITLIDYNEHID